jgi:hypothetical protein
MIRETNSDLDWPAWDSIAAGCIFPVSGSLTEGETLITSAGGSVNVPAATYYFNELETDGVANTDIRPICRDTIVTMCMFFLFCFVFVLLKGWKY